MVKVLVTDKDGREVEVHARPDWSLMESLRLLPGGVEAICGGMCACATCHVLVDPDWFARLPPRRLEERVMLQTSQAFDAARSRLSCQLKVGPELDGLRLTIAPDGP
jgi:2Fe-2S ferredoxin